MAVPKKKTSKSKRDMRRSHDGLKDFNGSVCTNCGATKRSHHVCPVCGWYDDKKIIENTQGKTAD